MAPPCIDFLALTSTTLFAGKQPDIMFHPEAYKYAVISGEVISVNATLLITM